MRCNRHSSITTPFNAGIAPPGQTCSAGGLIAEGRAKKADDILELMSGNICRCGATIEPACKKRCVGSALIPIAQRINQQGECR